MEGEDFERLPTYYAHSLIAAVGKQVKQSKELASFAAHLWLIGEPEDVERDAKRARAEFNVEVDPIPEEGSDKIDEKTGTPSTVSPATVAAV